MLKTNLPLINRSDYQAMPQGPPYFQVIEGELIMSPSPDTFHQDITLNVYFILRRYLEKRPVGAVYAAPLDVYLSETNVFQPDVVFISKERDPIIREHGIEGAPDLVVEILSPGTAAYDKGTKRKIYARAGVPELWLVDPATRLVEIYQLAEDAETPAATHGVRSAFASALLPGLRVKTADFFKSPLRAR